MTGIFTSVYPGEARAEDLVEGIVDAVPDRDGAFPLGETVIWWTAIDTSGNDASAGQQVVVLSMDAEQQQEEPAMQNPRSSGGESGGGSGGCTLGGRDMTDPVLDVLCLLALSGLVTTRHRTRLQS